MKLIGYDKYYQKVIGDMGILKATYCFQTDMDEVDLSTPFATLDLPTISTDQSVIGYVGNNTEVPMTYVHLTKRIKTNSEMIVPKGTTIWFTLELGVDLDG